MIVRAAHTHHHPAALLNVPCFTSAWPPALVLYRLAWECVGERAALSVGGAGHEAVADQVFALYQARVQREPRRHSLGGLYSLSVWRRASEEKEEEGTPAPRTPQSPMRLLRSGTLRTLRGLRALGSRGSLRKGGGAGVFRERLTTPPGGTPRHGVPGV